jgi:hypothetical protein
MPRNKTETHAASRFRSSPSWPLRFSYYCREGTPTILVQGYYSCNAYAPKLIVEKDSDTEYVLVTGYTQKNKKPMWFGAVRKGKAYVSYHLMALYGCAQSLEAVSRELKKRMQGKTCFNFKAVDESLFKELAALTKKGFAIFKKAAYV